MTEEKRNAYQTSVFYTDNNAYGDTPGIVSRQQDVPTKPEKRRELANCLSVTAVVVAISSLLAASVLGFIVMSRCSCDETASSVGKPIAY